MGKPTIRILGIDPGLRRTGWGLIESDGNRLMHVACGSVETSERASLGARLVAIHDGLIAVIEQYAPHEAAVENTFVNGNGASTLKLGQARGIAMLVPSRMGLVVSEYAPNLVKKTVVGAGHAEKAQIRMMIGVLLPKADPQSEDAADALAIAICHAHHRVSVVSSFSLPLKGGGSGRGSSKRIDVTTTRIAIARQRRASTRLRRSDLPLAGGGKEKR